MDERDIENIKIVRIHPLNREIPQWLPANIYEAYTKAEKIKAIDIDAYAIVARKLLELICKENWSIGKDLFEKIDDLVNKGILPKKLALIAHQIRFLWNTGAHENNSLTQAEVPIIQNLIDAVLTYLYTTNYLFDTTQSQINQIISRRKKIIPPNNSDTPLPVQD
jgi:hypothetical protein